MPTRRPSRPSPSRNTSSGDGRRGLRTAWTVTVAVTVVLLIAVTWWGRSLPRDHDRAGSIETSNATSNAHDARADVSTDALADAGTVASTKRTVESFECADCHAEVVANYARSGMSRTWSSDLESLDAPPGAVARVADARSGYRYAIDWDGSQLFQVESHAEHPDHSLRRQADFVIGSGQHAQAVGRDEQGYLTLLPAAWFAADATWRLNPGYELRNHRFDRPITPGCVACHATSAAHRPRTTNRFHTSVEDGIACRRCHGPSAAHVAHWRGNSTSEPGRAARLVNPGELAADRALDLCLQCHLQGDVTLYGRDREPLDFKPGERLRDHRHDFLIARDDPAALGVASHGARLLRSPCYQKSGGQLTCLTCHDPHRPTSDFTASDYDARCATCHQPAACARPRNGVSGSVGGASPIGRERSAGDAEPVESSSSCVGCHMPRRASREGIHLVFTDHAIERRRANEPMNVEQSGASRERSAAPFAPAVLPPNSEFELISCWPTETPSDRELGAAYVLAHESMGPQLPALRRGRALLERAIEQEPNDVESRFWLGAALLGLGEGRTAIEQLGAVVQRDPERAAARVRLATAYELTGDFGRATALYESLLRATPDWSELTPRLAQLYLFGQRPDAAIDLLERQLARREDAAGFAQLALARGLSGQAPSQALATVERAIALDPLLPAAYVNRAALHLLAGRVDLARADFERVLRLDPENAQAREALNRLNQAPPAAATP